MLRTALFVSLCVLPCFPLAADQETAKILSNEARTAFEKGQTDEALKLMGEAILQHPSSRTYSLRARMYEVLRKHQAAVDDLTAAIKLDAQVAELYQRRGVEQFKLGRFKESIVDFDKFIELEPGQERSHWQRGISYYYAGRFADGARQFAAYQTFDDNDVENAVWRFLCMARDVGVPKARASLLRNRMRVTLESLARGETIRPVKFRDGDFWCELAPKLNVLAARLGQLSEGGVVEDEDEKECLQVTR